MPPRRAGWRGRGQQREPGYHLHPAPRGATGAPTPQQHPNPCSWHPLTRWEERGSGAQIKHKPISPPPPRLVLPAAKHNHVREVSGGAGRTKRLSAVPAGHRSPKPPLLGWRNEPSKLEATAGETVGPRLDFGGFLCHLIAPHGELISYFIHPTTSRLKIQYQLQKMTGKD